MKKTIQILIDIISKKESKIKELTKSNAFTRGEVKYYRKREILFSKSFRDTKNITITSTNDILNSNKTDKQKIKYIKDIIEQQQRMEDQAIYQLTKINIEPIKL